MAADKVTRWTDAELDYYNATGIRWDSRKAIAKDDRAPEPNAPVLTEGDAKSFMVALNRLALCPVAYVHTEDANISRARHYLTS